MLAELTEAATGPEVQYLADIVSDGTKSNFLLNGVRALSLMVTVGVVGVFLIRIFNMYASNTIANSGNGRGDTSGGGTKGVWEETKYLFMVEGAIAVVWIVAEAAGGIFKDAMPWR